MIENRTRVNIGRFSIPGTARKLRRTNSRGPGESGFSAEEQRVLDRVTQQVATPVISLCIGNNKTKYGVKYNFATFHQQ